MDSVVNLLMLDTIEQSMNEFCNQLKKTYNCSWQDDVHASYSRLNEQVEKSKDEMLATFKEVREIAHRIEEDDGLERKTKELSEEVMNL